MTKAYRTASTEALQVLAGTLPLDLELEARTAVERLRLEEKEGIGSRRTSEAGQVEALANARHQWQARWSVSTKERWTERWFQSIEIRLQRPWVKSNYYVSQLITGHADFRASLHGISLSDTLECECGPELD